jgi:hypothetical protein
MGSPDLTRVGKCTARSKTSGGLCRQPAILGGTVCRYHGGAAPQVKLKALERLAAYQDRAIDRLFTLVEQTDYPSTAMTAVRDVLDRTMGKPVEKVDMTVSGEVSVVTARLQAARLRLARPITPPVTT